MHADSPFLRQQQEECYRATEGLLKRWVSNFLGKYRLDRSRYFEQFMSAAHEAWCETYRDVNLDKGMMSTLLGWRVRKHLYLELRRHIRETNGMHQPADPGSDNGFDMAALEAPVRNEEIQPLSEDARTLLELATERDVTVKVAMVAESGPIGKKPNPRRIRDAVASVLHEAGWTAKEILKAFKEIGEALLT